MTIFRLTDQNFYPNINSRTETIRIFRHHAFKFSLRLHKHQMRSPALRTPTVHPRAGVHSLAFSKEEKEIHHIQGSAHPQKIQYRENKSGLDYVHQDKVRLHRIGTIPNGNGAQGISFDDIQALCQQGHLEKAMDALSLMDHPCPVNNVYLSLLKSCIKGKALYQARQIHSHLVKHNSKLHGVLGDYLVVSLAKCGGIEEAQSLAKKLPRRTVFSWTAMISALTDSGRALEALDMYRQMQEDGVDPDHYTIVSVIKASGNMQSLEDGEKIHLDALKMGFASDIFVGNTLVSMYGKCGAVSKAEDVFGGLSLHNDVSCNSMLSVYVEQGQAQKALLLYRQMIAESVSPNELTFAIVIQACHLLAEQGHSDSCSKAMTLEIGRGLEHDAHKSGFGSDSFVCNMLMSMYGSCGTVEDGDRAFGNLSSWEVKSWTIMLTTYVEHQQGEKALQFFAYMHHCGIRPDPHMFVTALQACGILVEKEETSFVAGLSGKELCFNFALALHKDASKQRFDSDVFVGTALVTTYGKCGRLVEAEKVFSRLSERSIVSWTAVLSTYVEHGEHAKALDLCKHMRDKLVTLDDVTLICVLQACSETGNLDICKHIHFVIVFAGGYGQKVTLPVTLVHAYSSCASMVDASAVFCSLVYPDVVSYSACIAGHAGEGSCISSIQICEAMQYEGVSPNDVSFVSVLSGCSHAGAVDEGIEYFTSMLRNYSVTPSLKHYINMVDLLGRAGDFKKLEDMLKRMPMQADITVWLCLLGMCAKHGQLELGKTAFQNAISLQPEEAVAYILMSNIWAEAQLQNYCNELECFKDNMDRYSTFAELY